LSKVVASGKEFVFNDEILQNPIPRSRLHQEGPLHYLEVGSKWPVWSIVGHTLVAGHRGFRGNPNRTLEEARAAQDPLFALTEFFRMTVAERRRNKGTDLISLLLAS